jgi:SAM-dependent methyltransferase
MRLPANLLHCPACRTGFLAIHEDQQAHCGACRAAFPAVDGVIDLLPPATQKPGYAQRTMEWPWLVRMYESRWWRRNPVFAAGFGCSFEEEQAHILRSLALRTDARVLDLACGPGIYTRPIARAVPEGTALGLDISWPMLSYATARAREESVDNIVWLRASAFEIPIAGASLDAVSCCGALHLFADLSRVLSEIRRVLKPGGRFACGMSRRLDGRLGDLEMMTTTWSGLTARSSDELRSLLEGAGFGNAQILHSKRFWQIASAARPA